MLTGKQTNKKVAKPAICLVGALCEADRIKTEQSLTVGEGNVHGSGGKNRRNSTRNVSFNLVVTVEVYWSKTRKQAVREDKIP